MVSVSLAQVIGLELLQGPWIPNAFPEDLPSAALERDRLNFVGCFFESVPANDAEVALVLRPLLDHLANAAGLPLLV